MHLQHLRFNVTSSLFVVLMTALGASCAATSDTASSSQEITGTADAGVATTDGGHHPPGPPQAAIDACAALADGAACSVTFTDDHGSHSVTGTCSAGPDGNGVEACAPAHPPGGSGPGGPGGPGSGPPPTPPAAAIAACDGASSGDACDFTITAPDGTTHDLSGSCDSPPTDDDAGASTLACHPTPPSRP